MPISITGKTKWLTNEENSTLQTIRNFVSKLRDVDDCKIEIINKKKEKIFIVSVSKDTKKTNLEIKTGTKAKGLKKLF